MADRLLFIDGLRGVAASLVVLCHLMSRTSADFIFTYGYLGVAIFFVLSGFVIAMAIGDRRMSFAFMGRFAARRAIRLDPPYWLSIAAAIVLAALAAHIGVQKDFPAVTDVLAHLVYAQDLIGIKAISEVYWTLCYEVQFYLFLIVLLWIGQAVKAKVGSAVFQIGLFGLMIFSLLERSSLVNVTPTGLFMPYWFAFSLGAMTYWTVAGRMSARYLISALLLVGAFSFLRHGDWCAVAAITAAAIYAASKLNVMAKWLAGPVWQFLGKISYSLYLFHPIVGWSAMSVAMKFTNAWGAALIGIAASVVSAYVVYLFVERYSITMSRWVKLERPIEAPDIPPLRA